MEFDIKPKRRGKYQKPLVKSVETSFTSVRVDIFA